MIMFTAHRNIPMGSTAVISTPLVQKIRQATSSPDRCNTESSSGNVGAFQ